MEYLEGLHPTLLAFISAFTFAAAQSYYRLALGKLSPTSVTIVVNAILCLGGLALYFPTGGVERWAGMGLLWFALVGMLGPSFGRFMNFLSIVYIGLARTHVMAQTTPVWSALVAMALLGERITPGVAAGTGGILIGALLLVQKKERERQAIPLRNYLLALAGPLALAFTPTLRKMGFAHIPSVPAGLIVSMGVGTLLQCGTLRWVEKGSFRGWDRPSLLRAVAGGLLNFLAALTFWTALRVGDVVSVVPITRLTIVFVLLFSWLFFPKQEALTWRVVAGGMLAMGGELLIAFSR